MRLVSKEEAKLARILIEHLHQDASDCPESPLEQNVIALTATVQALWPIVEWAARQPCPQDPMVQMAHRLVKEAKGKDVPVTP